MSSYRPLIAATGLRKSCGGKLVPGGHRPGCHRRNGRSAARAQRCQQDHRHAHPVHADRRRRRGPGRWPRRAHEPDAVWDAISVTGQSSVADGLLTGEATRRSWLTGATSTVPLEHGASRGGGPQASWRRAR